MFMTVRVLAVFAVLSVTSVHAQEPQPRNIEKPLVLNLKDAQQAPEVPQPPDPPVGASGWSLSVHTTGGFTGRGVGSVTISSDGQMACAGAPCATPIAAQMKLISTTIGSIVEAAWLRQAPSGFCRDCVHTTVVLKRREGDAVRTYIASWDDSQRATRELRELRRLALELRAAPSGR
jgi:hypothetical protein